MNNLDELDVYLESEEFDNLPIDEILAKTIPRDVWWKWNNNKKSEEEKPKLKRRRTKKVDYTSENWLSMLNDTDLLMEPMTQHQHKHSGEGLEYLI